MAMDFSTAINEIMPLVNDGDKTKPFIITRDSAYGDWEVCYPAPDKADSFTISQRENDPYTSKYYGADFDRGSMPYVYNKVLCDRLRSEYFEYSLEDRHSDADKSKLRALINFFEDNINSFTHTVTDYLAELEQPFRSLEKMCPFNLATGHEGWTFNQDLAADAIDHIMNAAEDRLHVKKDEPVKSDKRIINGYEELNCIRINHSEIILAENPDAEHRYMVVENRFTEYYINSGNYNIYKGHTNDFLEALDIFTQQVRYNIDCVKSTREVHQNLHGIEPIMLTAADCLPDSHKQDFTGKLIIVKAEELQPEYCTAENQYVLCSHGNGARPGAIGTTVFATELLSGSTVCFGRHQIEGIADPAKMPEWAVDKLKAQQPERINQPPKQQTAIKPAQPPQPKQPPSLLDEVREAAQIVEHKKTERGNAPVTKKKDGLEV
jgi:hypothetical protein